jgi:hypothetical protein
MIRVNTFRLKVELLLFLNKLVRRCRMHDMYDMYCRLPASLREVCGLRARRGGFFLCRRLWRLKGSQHPAANAARHEQISVN